ncbi:hypothetical protein EV05_0129 [Prochlorococcus sp. MIT 0601]|nr:hypothetical protein EV05_0129 [Prochlorococcus sp. MIT 0601]
MPSLLLIPTGIGCSIGGYAGDAIPYARLLASASGCLITHPNVMNGATLYWSDRRIQYVEGYAIDRFATGEVLLNPVRKQKLGLILDKGIEKDLRERHLQVVDACKTSLGIDIGPILITDNPLGISLTQGTSGSSWGGIENPDSLLRAGDKLKSQGATAIAVVTRFPDDLDSEDLEAYRKGKGVDPLAGAEAIISHLLVKHLNLPCAHAPALNALPLENFVDPRSAAEELGHTFLPCVLVGLSRAPSLVEIDRTQGIDSCLGRDLISIDHVGAVIAPDGALGGAAVLACIERNIPLIVVSNRGVLNVTASSLGLDTLNQVANNPIIYTANNYLEAAGLISGLREGIAIQSLRRPIK